MSRLASIVLLVLAAVLLVAYFAWPWIQIMSDPQQADAERAKTHLRVGASLHQVFAVTQPFLGTGVKGGLWLSSCADPDLSAAIRYGHGGSIAYFSRARMQMTEAKYPSLADLIRGVEQDPRLRTCSSGLLRFGIWGIPLRFSNGALESFSDIEYTD
jgi:hypothetical protein